MTEFDITETLAPASDQLDAIELVSGPRTFEVERVSRGNAEQPVQVHLVDFPRPWRPGKSMRRVLAAGWGNDASTWVGHKVTLFFDADVTFGREKPGGTRIAAMSHIDGPLSVPLLISRGKSATYKVDVLPDTPGASVAPAGGPQSKAAPGVLAPDGAPGVDIEGCDSIPTLRGWWKDADTSTRKKIEARVKALEAEALDA
jgi:hypothetical protein